MTLTDRQEGDLGVGHEQLLRTGFVQPSYYRHEGAEKLTTRGQDGGHA